MILFAINVFNYNLLKYLRINYAKSVLEGPATHKRIQWMVSVMSAIKRPAFFFLVEYNFSSILSLIHLILFLFLKKKKNVRWS